MKVSISLSDEDLEFLDRETKGGGYPSRSAAVAAAIRVLRERELIASYTEAFADWPDSEAGLWDSAAADGLDREEWPEYAAGHQNSRQDLHARSTASSRPDRSR